MQVASILSDLTSLKVCDHKAALALVSSYKTSTSTSTSSPISNKNISQQDTAEDTPTATATDTDESMQRAIDLLDLHYGVKVRLSQQGQNEGLMQARRDVEGVLRALEAGGGSVVGGAGGGRRG